MSVICRVLVLIASSIILGGAPLAAEVLDSQFPGSQSEAKAVCNSSGECSVHVGSENVNILSACSTSRASLSWSRKEKGVFLVACDCSCTSHDNSGWLISASPLADEYEVKKLYLGKKFTVEELGQDLTNISDIMISHPLCEKVNFAKLKLSAFVTLLKQPTSDQSIPYCFLPAYILVEREGARIETNDVESHYGKRISDQETDPLLRARLVNFVVLNLHLQK